MIRIDRMIFDFTAPEEDFTSRLYADWDGFFHKCVETVMDECLSDYDKDKVLREIDRLDLDLGAIPETDFYNEFPKRLKAELLKNILEWDSQHTHDNEQSLLLRLENLLHYLEFGYHKPEWADAECSPEDELAGTDALPTSMQEKIMQRIASLCLRHRHVLRRLLWQNVGGSLLAAIYAAALNETWASTLDKKRLLSEFLETRPDIPVDFIRKTANDSSLRSMAELLDTRSVGSIMRKETETHAEVNLFLYWHYLYEWAVRYYPYNGIAIFGGKADFVRHLHYRLLTFIHKRNSATYLSKAELTVAFLQEVFGLTYYKDVLNAIYRLHPRHVDGSPVDDGFFSMELYRTFLQLSLLQPFEEGNGEGETVTLTMRKKKYLENEYVTDEYLSVLLNDRGQDDTEKRKTVNLLAESKPEYLIGWLRAETIQGFRRVVLLAGYIDNETVNRLLVTLPSVSLKTVDAIREALLSHPRYAVWLNRMTKTQLDLAIRQSVLLWIATGTVDRTGGNGDVLLRLILCEITGGMRREISSMPDGLADDVFKSYGGVVFMTQELLQGMARRDFHRAIVLSGVVEWLQRKARSYPFLISVGLPMDLALSRALLAYLQNEGMEKSVVTDRDIMEKFLFHLRLVISGKGTEADIVQWERLAEEVFGDCLPDEENRTKEYMVQVLSDRSATGFTLRQSFGGMMERHPNELLIWMEEEADEYETGRLAEASDEVVVTHWADFLSHTAGFVCPDAFRQFVAWLMRRVPLFRMADALFGFVRKPGWKAFTADEMEAYFFSRLYGTEVKPANMEMLANESLPKETRKRLFWRYLRFDPEKLLAFIRESVLQNTQSLDKWTEWIDTADWLDLVAEISLSKAELLKQMTDCLSLSEDEGKQVLATYIIYGNTKEWAYDTPKETVHDFVNALPSMQGVEAGRKEETVCLVEAKLGLSETDTLISEELSAVFAVHNAGLCLLGPWLVRLFDMLGYLNEEKKHFRNTASKVRAVFLLQYIAWGKEMEWRETELAFNRLLTALPGNIPLPKRLYLTEEEKQTADGMVVGVKANWSQMNGTSVEGFRGSFLVREGMLELDEEHWTLRVKEKTYDILLDTIPWSFRQIRLPWLNKYVQVRWHDKQNF